MCNALSVQTITFEQYDQFDPFCTVDHLDHIYVKLKGQDHRFMDVGGKNSQEEKRLCTNVTKRNTDMVDWKKDLNLKR